MRLSWSTIFDIKEILRPVIWSYIVHWFFLVFLERTREVLYVDHLTHQNQILNKGMQTINKSFQDFLSSHNQKKNSQ